MNLSANNSDQRKVLLFGIFCGFILSFWLLQIHKHSLDFTKISQLRFGYENLLGFNGLDHRDSNNKNLTAILDSQVKILCWVMTNPTNKFKWKHIQNTWGQKCSKLLFMSSATDYHEEDGIEVIGLSAGEGRQNLWAKTKEGFIYIHRNFLNQFDWFMKVDDDTYIVMENLKYLLYQYNPNQSLIFGSRYFIPQVAKGYMAGMSYVLSSKALHKFYDRLMMKKCRNDSQGAEDAEIAKCLADAAIQVDTRDSKGRHRFFPVPIQSALDPFGKPYWYQFNQFYKLKMGSDCCSDTPIGFHYIKPETMYVLDYFFYSVYPFGLPDYDHDQLPEKISTEKVLANSMGIDFMRK